MAADLDEEVAAPSRAIASRSLAGRQGPGDGEEDREPGRLPALATTSPPTAEKARLLPPALELGRVEHDVADRRVGERLRDHEDGVPAGWSGRSMKGRRAITFGCPGPARLRHQAPAEALVEAEDAEIAAGAGHRRDHRRGALVGEVRSREAEMESGESRIGASPSTRPRGPRREPGRR